MKDKLINAISFISDFACGFLIYAAMYWFFCVLGIFFLAVWDRRPDCHWILALSLILIAAVSVRDALRKRRGRRSGDEKTVEAK